MDQPQPENGQGKARILVAPLDWGLGHATRCIPLVRELKTQGAEVWLAAEGAPEQLLRAEFPDLPILPLPGYRIRYAKSGIGLPWKMILQLPKMQRAIRQEHAWLQHAVQEHRFDAVISDNRYGLYHSDIPCIFITHQLQIRSPLGGWTEKILQKRNYRYINRFTACWVPDKKGEDNLGGALSHPAALPRIPVRYIGWLSRFRKTSTVPPVANKLLVVLSGPEPQRSILEEIIIRAIPHYNGYATVVRGLPGAASLVPSTNMIEFFNHLPAEDLQAAMEQASLVISRSGYSTVMDLAALQKKSVLVPTPGQTEQEYLGHYLQEKGIALCIRQKEFSLNTALAAAEKFRYTLPEPGDNSSLESVTRDFLRSIPAR